MKISNRYKRLRLLPFFSTLAPVLLVPLFDCLLIIFDPLLGVGLGGIFSCEIKKSQIRALYRHIDIDIIG
jgi:hypothetical protein